MPTKMAVPATHSRAIVGLDVLQEQLLLSKADKAFMEECRNVLVLLEYYKLELSLVMPKICLLVRKA